MFEEIYNKIKIKAYNRIKSHGLCGFFIFSAKAISILFIFTPICVLIRILKPIKFIRVGTLHDNRIGHFVINVELYLCEKEHGIQPQNSIDIFFHGDEVCNFQLLKMWKRVLPISRIARYIHFTFTNLFFGQEHIITTTQSDRDVFGLMEKSKVHLQFTGEEDEQAALEMQKMGIEINDPYVCIVARDGAYLNHKYAGKNWDYHNYRDCNIQNYLLAVESLTEKGYHVIRMGEKVSELMHTENPKIIEYAHKGYRTELLDIYLTTHCDFFVSCSTGLDSVADVFRRPIVYVNLVPLHNINAWAPRSISTFKKYRLIEEKRFMSVREMLQIGCLMETEEFKKRGIELVENTPEEIRDVVTEMEARLKGTWQPTAEDEELQKRFWALFEPNKLNRVFRSRIGAKFLRENKYLLN